MAAIVISGICAQERPYRPTNAKLTDQNSFSMIVYPDPQGYVKYAQNQPILELMTTWTAYNIDRLNIKAVLCTGDIVEFNELAIADPRMSNQNSVEQWEGASRAFEQIDGKVPYINCLGNHDYGYKSSEKRITNFSKYFPFDRNPLWKDCLVEVAHNYEDKPTLENAAYEFSDDNWGKILVLVLEFSPRDEILEWAKKVCDSNKYKNHKVIVLTHSYMDYKGKVYESEDYLISPANYGKDIWERLLYSCPNVKLLICGHDARIGSFEQNVGFRTDKNIANKNVHQMMWNAQTAGGGWEGNGGDGWLRILEFMPDGKTIKVKTFSPLLAISEAAASQAWRTEKYDQFDIIVE
ncbi:metallophosphoesterase [Dysgonomonas sp. 25]|uniref:metallophosphoesterase n=1 Tax=Dysgonomonas sp. 25 TaxID=2302933 RepID=UPI00210852D8|nr:metallophosphoesterase [Dysgonomonas sp. 25]